MGGATDSVEADDDGNGDDNESDSSVSPEVEVVPFRGPFQACETRRVGPEPTTLSFAMPEFLDELAPAVCADLAFDPSVCRLRFYPERAECLRTACSGCT